MLKHRNFLSLAGAAALVAGLSIPMTAQDRDRDRDDHYRERERITRIEPGTKIEVRTNQTIDVERKDERVYRGVVERDVFGENGRLAIPRGSNVDLAVRVAPDNDLILDLDSVYVEGARYSVRADPDRVESRKDNSIVGAIVGSITGVEVRGRAVRVPRDSVLTFRVDRPMTVTVPDPGIRHDDRDDRR